MRVLQDGVLHRLRWRKEVLCRGCGSRLETSAEDVQYADLAVNDWRFFVACPVCGHKIVAIQPLPDYVRANAMERGNPKFTRR